MVEEKEQKTEEVNGGIRRENEQRAERKQIYRFISFGVIVLLKFQCIAEIGEG